MSATPRSPDAVGCCRQDPRHETKEEIRNRDPPCMRFRRSLRSRARHLALLTSQRRTSTTSTPTPKRRLRSGSASSLAALFPAISQVHCPDLSAISLENPYFSNTPEEQQILTVLPKLKGIPLAASFDLVSFRHSGAYASCSSVEEAPHLCLEIRHERAPISQPEGNEAIGSRRTCRCLR